MGRRHRSVHKLLVAIAAACLTLPPLRTAAFILSKQTWQTSLRRRLWLTQATLGSALLPVSTHAEEQVEQVKRLAVVETYPPFGSLVPLTGVFSLAQSAAKLTDPDDLPSMSKRFGKLSNDDLDAYRFVCTQYIGLIRYADPDEKVIGYDKAGRFKACDDAIAAVGRARDLLKKSDAKDKAKKKDLKAFQKEVSAIGVNLAGFFALIPQGDFVKALSLAQKLRSMDADKNNQLSEEEVTTVRSGMKPLSQDDADIVAALRKLGAGRLLVP
ncbi:unnamed protein product [Symbiodinium natans]|uniref:EF-hand domain-containing protein n=1 Tax=Symbiodinium natans TaxID=878477 RepID=A0A812THV6_9DINO|nr:unnamed protein product [Symbiodinium natans]